MVRLSTGSSAGAPGLFRADTDTSPCGSEDATPRSPACVCARSFWPGRVGRPLGRILVCFPFPVAIVCACFVSAAPSRQVLPCFCLFPPFVFRFFSACLAFLFVFCLVPCVSPPPPRLFLAALCFFFSYLFFLPLGSLAPCPLPPPAVFCFSFSFSPFIVATSCWFSSRGGGGAAPRPFPPVPVRPAVQCAMRCLLMACVPLLWCALCWWWLTPSLPSPRRHLVALWRVFSRSPPFFLRVPVSRFALLALVV